VTLCNHPRPALNLPGYTPPRYSWQPPSFLPSGSLADLSRALTEQFRGVYAVLQQLGQRRAVVPLLEDFDARAGQMIVGVGAGQTIRLPDGIAGELGQVGIVLTDVSSPVTVVHPDGSTTSLGAAGAYDFVSGEQDVYQTSPGGSVLAGSVPTDTLLGRDSAGTGAVEFIGVTFPLEFTSAGAIRIASSGVDTGDLADDAVTNAKLDEMAANTVKGNATASTANPTDIALPTLSVLGRSDGDIQAITATAGNQVLRCTGSGTFVNFSHLTTLDLPIVTDGTVIMNVSGATAAPGGRNAANLAGDGLKWDGVPINAWRVNGSTSIVVDATADEVQRAALTGDVTASQNSNATTIAANAVTDTKLRQSAGTSVIGRSANTTGNVADITASADDLLLARVSGSLGFTSLSIGMIPNGIITLAKLAGISANTLVGNPTASTANPTEVAVGTNTVVGRVGGNLVAAALVTAQITDDNVTNAKLANMATQTFKGRTTAGTGDPEDLTASQAAGILAGQFPPNNAEFVTYSANATLTAERVTTSSTTVTVSTAVANQIEFQRAALTGDVTASANSNATTIATGAVTLAKMADLADSTIIGRAKGAGTGVPTALTGFQALAMLRITDNVDTTTTGVQTNYPTTANSYLRINTPSTLLDIQGMTAPSPSNSFFIIQIDRLKAGGAGSVVFRHENASATGLRLNCPGNVDLFPKPGDVIFCVDHNNRWVLSCRTLTDGDKGDITVSSSGDTWTIDNDVVSDAKLRNSGACSVIGRSANSSGDPADISAGADDRVLVRRSGALSFTTIVNNDITNGTIDPTTKIAGISANSVLGNDTAATANPAVIAVGSNTVLGRQGSNIVAAQVATGQIADDAVTNAKAANMAQSTIKGRAEGAGTGDPTDLTPTQVVAIIDAESPTWTASHRFDSFIQFGTSTALPAAGDIRKAGTLAINSADDINLTALDNCTLDISNTLTLDGGAGVTITSGNRIQTTAPFEVASALRLKSVVSSAASGAINNLAIGSANIVRLTAATSLTGMVPSSTGGVVLIVNASSGILSIPHEDTGSTAANRFAGSGTALAVRPGELQIGYYDPTSTRWYCLSGVT
jgi:uncharacterized protein DUF5907